MTRISHLESRCDFAQPRAFGTLPNLASRDIALFKSCDNLFKRINECS